MDSTRSDAPATFAAPGQDGDNTARPRLARLSSLLRAATEAGALLAHVNEEPEVYEAVCRFAVMQVHCQLAWVGLSEPGTRAIRVQASFGGPGAFLAAAGLTIGSAIQGHNAARTAFSTRVPSIVEDLTTSDDECARSGPQHGLRSLVAIPMRAGSLAVGVLSCYAAEAGSFGSDEIAILEALVGQAMTRLAAIEKDRNRHEAQSALHKTEERYRLLFEAAPLGVMVIGPDGVEVNDSLIAMFGYLDRDSVGDLDLEALVPEDCREDIEAFRESLVGEDRTPAIIRTIGLRADGSTFPLLVDGTQVAVGDGVNGVYFLTDLGPMDMAESLARTARGQYRHLVEAAPLPIISMTTDGVVQSWNPAAERAFGWTAAEVVGRMLPGGISGRDRAYLDAVANGREMAGAQETSIRRRDGKTLDLRLRASQIVDSAGSLTGLLLIAEDVTKEHRLAAERIRLATAVDQTAESIVITDPKANIVYVNPAFERITGYGRDEVIGKNPRVLKSGSQPPEYYREMWATLAAGNTWVGEFTNRRKDGGLFTEEATISPIRSEAGGVSGFVAVKRDVTVQRAQQAALAASERSYKSLFDNMQEGFAFHRMIWDNGVPVDYEFVSANDAFGELTGLRDVVGKRVSQLLPGLRESDPELFEIYGRVAAGGAPERLRSRIAAMGMWFAVSVYCPEPGYFAAVIENVTEQENAAEALRSSEEKFARAFRSAPVLVAIVDVETGELVDANDQALTVEGQVRDEALGRTPAELGWLEPESFDASLELMRSVDRFEAQESVRVTRDGRRLDMLTYGERIFVAGRNCFLITGVDITARKQAERALEEHKRLLQSVIDATTDSIYAKDRQGKYLLVNVEGARTAGKSIDEIVGGDDRAIFPAQTAEQIRATDRELLASGEIVTLEERLTDLAGAERWYFTTKGPLLDEKGQRVGLFGVSRDVTKRKRLEQVAEARTRLLDLSLTATLDEVLEAMLTEAEDLTSSCIGFYHFVEDDQVHLTLTQWSPRTKRLFCKMKGTGDHYPIDQAGVWVDCVRRRAPVIHNDYANTPGRKGLPEGHAALTRELVVPVFRGDRIRAIVGVGNKAGNYTDHDVEAVVRLADQAFDIAERMRAESAMRRSEEIYRTILENAPFAIGTHRNGKGLFANEAHRKMFGYTDPETLLHMQPQDMLAPESLEQAHDYLRRRAAGEKTEPEYEVVGRRQDGTTFPMLLRFADIVLPDGPASILFHLDLTDIRQAQAAVRQSEEKFSSAFKHSPVAVYITDLETGQIVDANEEALRVSGYPLSELAGRRLVDIGWLSEAEFGGIVAEVRSKGRIAAREVHRRSKDGRPLDALMYVERILISGRECMLTSSIGITERKELERKLDEARALQQAVADSTPDWVFSVDPDNFGLTSFNRAFAEQADRVFGLKLELGMRPEAMDADPARRGAWLGFFRRAVSDGSFAIEYAAGLDVTLDLTFNRITRDGDVIGVSVFGRDITEARRAEISLRESEERFRVISENSLSGLAFIDEGHFQYVNPAFSTILGYPREEMIGRDVLSLVFADDRALVAESLAPGSESDPATEAYRARAVRQDGKVRELQVFGARADLEGRPVIVANVLDMTEASEAEAALRASEARFRAVSENSLSGIAMVEEGRIQYVNRAFAAIFGYEPDELVGEDPLRLVSPVDRARALETISGNDNSVSSPAFEATGLRKDGTTNVILVLSSRVPLDGRPVVISNVLDITERKRLEDDLRQSQKLEALGRLAGGVAHDFNNLLTAIGGYARLLKEDLATGVSDPDYAVRIVEAADRAGAMTSRLLAFSGRQAKRRVPVDVTDSVRQILPIIRRVVPERIEIAPALRPVPSVLADATEIDQILLNLVVNASDAISAAGRISIETSLVEHDEEFVRLNPGSQLGSHVRLAIEDNGSGMDAATLAHMYEPFFTTKPNGAGTGLGLAMTYGIVDGMGGSIVATSAPGAGTTFRIDLPTSGEATVARTDTRAGLPPGTERVLLVEDEPTVLNLSEKILKRLGYRVTAVGDSRLALELAATDFDLVITDVVMPRMDGPDMVREIRKVHPSIPVLYVSGYQPKGEMTAALQEPRTSLLAKPFSWASLAHAARAALDPVKDDR